MSSEESSNKFQGPAPLFQSYLASSPRATPASIGVFWDIENCSIPFHKSALGFVQKIRDRFFVSRKEAEFMCVCDTSNQNKDTIQELNDAQVTVVHISAVSKNTADDKIRQSLRRFAADHKPPADVILISGDVNFASDLSDLRYRHHIHIILIHRKQVAIALTSCAHESFCFEDFVEDLPTRTLPQTPEVSRELVVTNLPVGVGVQNSLQRLCKSVRGRIIKIDGTTALLRFPSNEATLRAQKRLNGECLMERKIKVSFPQTEGGSYNRRSQPATVPNGDENFQVAYSIARLRENTTPEVVQKKNGILSSQQGDVSVMQSPADARTATEDERETKKLTADNDDNKEAVQKQSFSQPSAEVLAGDIVIEGEEEEECAETCQDVSFKASFTADNKVDSVDGGISGVMDIDYRPTKLKTEAVAEKSKRKRKQKYKASSVEESHKASAGTEKLQGVVMEKQKYPTSASFVDINHHQGNATNSNITSRVKVVNDMMINAGHLLSHWPLGTPMKDTGSGIEDTLGSRMSACGQSSTCGKDETSYLVHNWQAANKIEELNQRKDFSFQPYDLEQTYCTGSKTHEGRKCIPLMPNIGENENCNELKTSTPWKSSPPGKFSFESANPPTSFRRTPGARRPRDGKASNGSVVHKKHLVSSAAETDLSSSVYFAGHVSRVSDNGPSGKQFLSSSEGNGLFPAGVDMIVSNLDYNISTNEWKKILADEFRQHVRVVDVRMQVLQDNTSVGYVRVPCTEDAYCVISHLHRKKIGYKRIHVALVNNESPLSFASIKAEVASLLQEVSGNQLPLVPFIELFEKRFRRRLSISELCHMKDTVDIIEQEGSGRTVVLLPIPKDRSTSRLSEENLPEHLESSVCRIHCCWGTSNFAEPGDKYNLLHVVLQLRTFSAQVHKLLQSHDGSLPLVSFPRCFAAEFSELKTVMDGGIPLEHLITCVPGVQISLSEGGIKTVQWAENRTSSSYKDNLRQSCSSPGIGQQMSQFAHEVIDLLRNCTQCRVHFSKFIPAYHHHFGRQLRVADYGCTKLMELFEAIPHVAQIIGDGCQKCVTLTHKAQVKRFTVDLLRILKSQSSKQISVVDLPVIYNKIVGRTFDISEYGVCFLEDLIGELPDSSFSTIGTGLDMIIALPKREQTPEEMERTKQFSRETIDLLRHSPQYRMSFSKFIPSYHHHFGKQCRVADYGFTKLMELFEAIPDVIKILDQQDEKILCLTERELIRLIEERIVSLLRSCPGNRIAISDFPTAYSKAFGRPLRLGDFDVKSVANLVEKIPSVAQVVVVEDGRSFICLVDRTEIQLLARNVLLILMDLTDGSILLEPLVDCYQQKFCSGLDVNLLTTDLQGIVEVTLSGETRIVKLTPLQMFARDVRTLLFMSDCQLHMNQFERNYSQYYGVKLSPASYGFPNVLALLQAVPHVVALKGKGCRRVLVLMQQFREKLVHLSTFEAVGDLSVSTTSKSSKSDTPSSDSGYAGNKDALLAVDDQELVTVLQNPSSTADLLSDPVPSCVPSPDLLPQPQRPPSCLIRFDVLPQKPGIDFLMLSEDEKFGLITPLCRTPVSDMLAFAAQLLPAELHRKSVKENSSEENTSALLSIAFQSELNKELTPGDRELSGNCELLESNVSSVEIADVDCENEEMTKGIVEEEEEEEGENGSSVDISVADGFGSESCTDYRNNLDFSARSVNNNSVGDTTLDPPCDDDHTDTRGLVVFEGQSLGKREEVLPENADCAECEQFPVSFQAPISKVSRKPDSVRRSRIAARFDVSPKSSTFTTGHD